MRDFARMSYFSAALFAPIVPAPIALAQPAPGLIYTVVIPAGEFGSSAYTGVLVGGLAAAQKFCSELGDDAYKVDCLAERYGAMADSIPKNSDYSEVRGILKSASDQMADLARSNRDPNRPRGKATRPGTTETTSRALTPVSAAATAQVNQQALAILSETQTLLLRSAEGSESKIAQYAKIAQAVNSNKVLLRSA